MVSCGNMGQVMSAMTNGTGLGNAIKSVIGLDKVKAQQLIGDWKYKGPGCAFTSENLLAKAGGEIAAVQIEEKVQPYYQQVGLSAENTFISFKEDGTFSSSTFFLSSRINAVLLAFSLMPVISNKVTSISTY